MEEELGLIEALYERIVKDDLSEAHIKLDNIYKSKGNDMTGVVSVYKNTKPANDILDELKDWAIEHKKQDVLNKIEGLSIKR